MKKSEIRVGGLYTAKVSGRFVTVRVDAIRDASSIFGDRTSMTRYDITNLATGRKVTFHSAAKFRSEAPTTVKDCDPVREAEKDARDFEEANSQEQEASEEADPTTAGGVDDEVTPLVVFPSAVSAVPLPSFAANLATLRSNASSTSGLTKQQEEILATAKMLQDAKAGIKCELRQIDGQWVLVVGAGAGTGKTFTLQRLEEILVGIGRYTAFNKPLVEGSKKKFKKARCSTTHGLAFGAVGRLFVHRLPPNSPRIKSYKVAEMLGITDFQVSGTPYPEGSLEYNEAATAAGYDDDNPAPADFRPAPLKTLKASYLAGQAIEAVKRFCQSDAREIGNQHFRQFAGVDEQGEYTNSNKVRDYLMPFALKAWDDFNDPNGKLPYAHDYYVKSWQLGQGNDRPFIHADYILLDEAQDTAPVFLDILKQQKHSMLIMVGDDNQQIYEWRGAINAMASFKGAPRRLLSQSFRFGQTVADVANSILATLEEPTDLVMSGLSTIPTRVCKVEQPRCYLFRTNAGAIGRLMSARDEGKRGHLIGGSKEVVDFCQAAMDLQTKPSRGTSHPDLGCFANWSEVQEYSKEDEGQELRLLVKLIDDFGAENIRDALRDMPDEEEADLVLSTAHRSKGREWSSVKLGQDFPLPNRMTDADRRLVYVAATRAMEELDISECPTFAGGYDKRDTGNAETSGAWIPGIDITYTIEMPTAEELEAYRTGKTAPKSVAMAQPPASTPQPAPVPIASPKAVSASANGNGNGYPPVTFSKLRDGSWGIRSSVEISVGSTVTVERRDGTKNQATVKRIVWTDGGIWLATIV